MSSDWRQYPGTRTYNREDNKKYGLIESSTSVEVVIEQDVRHKRYLTNFNLSFVLPGAAERDNITKTLHALKEGFYDRFEHEIRICTDSLGVLFDARVSLGRCASYIHSAYTQSTGKCRINYGIALIFSAGKNLPYPYQDITARPYDQAFQFLNLLIKHIEDRIMGALEDEERKLLNAERQATATNSVKAWYVILNNQNQDNAQEAVDYSARLQALHNELYAEQRRSFREELIRSFINARNKFIEGVKCASTCRVHSEACHLSDEDKAITSLSLSMIKRQAVRIIENAELSSRGCLPYELSLTEFVRDNPGSDDDAALFEEWIHEYERSQVV